MSAAGPTCAILAPSTTSVAFSITRPSPTINRAPSYAVTDCANAVNAKATSKLRATTTATAATFTRCMGTSSMNHALQLQSEIAASSEAIIEAALIEEAESSAISSTSFALSSSFGDKHRLKRSIGRQLWLFPLGVAESLPNLIELDNLIPIEAVGAINNDKETTLRVLAKYFKRSDPNFLDETYGLVTKFVEKTPRIDPRNVATVLEFEPVKGVGAETLVPKVIDNSVVDKLVKEGFIEKVFAKTAR